MVYGAPPYSKILDYAEKLSVEEHSSLFWQTHVDEEKKIGTMKLGSAQPRLEPDPSQGGEHPVYFTGKAFQPVIKAAFKCILQVKPTNLSFKRHLHKQLHSRGILTEGEGSVRLTSLYQLVQIIYV